MLEPLREYVKCVFHSGPSVSGAITLLIHVTIEMTLAATRADWANPDGAEGHWPFLSVFRSQRRSCAGGLLTAGAPEGGV